RVSVGIQLDGDVLAYRHWCLVVNYRNGEAAGALVSVYIGCRKFKCVHAHRKLASAWKSCRLYNSVNATVIERYRHRETGSGETFAGIGIGRYIFWAHDCWGNAILHRNDC